MSSLAQSPPVPNAPPSPRLYRPPQSNTVRVRLTITDAAGMARAYHLVPLPSSELSDETLWAFRLTVVDETETRSYRVWLNASGQSFCDCRGFTSHHHCKHLRSLQAAGILPISRLLEIRGLQLMVSSRLAHLDSLPDRSFVGNPWGC